MLAGLAVGGVVIATTEGSAAGQVTGAGAGGFGPRAGFGVPGQPVPQGQMPGAPGGRVGRGTATVDQQLLSCLRQQGISAPANQLRLRFNDPQLRQAFETCRQQLGGPPSQRTGRP
jgi:hypothetical protein